MLLYLHHITRSSPAVCKKAGGMLFIVRIGAVDNRCTFFRREIGKSFRGIIHHIGPVNA